MKQKSFRNNIYYYYYYTTVSPIHEACLWTWKMAIRPIWNHTHHWLSRDEREFGKAIIHNQRDERQKKKKKYTNKNREVCSMNGISHITLMHSIVRDPGRKSS